MKLCKCGLDPEHIFYGGELLKVWLKKIFNGIIAVPVCLKEGVILPCVQRKGKDPLQRKTTLSPVIAKFFSSSFYIAYLSFLKSCVS